MKRFAISTTILFLVVLNLPFYLTLANAKTPTGDIKTMTIVALGDSLTDGYGLERNQAYPALVESSLQKKGHKIRIINAGISGSTTASGPSRIKWFLKAKPDYVFIALGANDGLRAVSPKETRKNIETMIEQCQIAGAKVLLAGMKMPPNFGEKFTREFEQIFSDIAKSKNIPYLPFFLDGVAGVPSLNQPDAIHPNEKGHEIIAKTVEAFFLKHIFVNTTGK